ncbi:hypothetical protein [Natrinema thermotolerans]
MTPDTTTDDSRDLTTAFAGVILLAFFGTWLLMEWTGRQPDSLILLGAVAIAIGAGYHLWGSAMGEGVQAVDDLQSDGNDGGSED